MRDKELSVRIVNTYNQQFKLLPAASENRKIAKFVAFCLTIRTNLKHQVLLFTIASKTPTIYYVLWYAHQTDDISDAKKNKRSWFIIAELNLNVNHDCQAQSVYTIYTYLSPSLPLLNSFKYMI